MKWHFEKWSIVRRKLLFFSIGIFFRGVSLDYVYIFHYLRSISESTEMGDFFRIFGMIFFAKVIPNFIILSSKLCLWAYFSPFITSVCHYHSQWFHMTSYHNNFYSIIDISSKQTFNAAAANSVSLLNICLVFPLLSCDWLDICVYVPNKIRRLIKNWWHTFCVEIFLLRVFTCCVCMCSRCFSYWRSFIIILNCVWWMCWISNVIVFSTQNAYKT